MHYLTFHYSINSILNVNTNVFKNIITNVLRVNDFDTIKLKKLEFINAEKNEDFKVNLWISIDKKASFANQVDKLFKTLSSSINHFLKVPLPNVQVFIAENENFI